MTLDASTTLTHKIKTLRIAKHKVSTRFLDIKGGLANVNPQQLSCMLRSRRVSPYLVS